MGTLSEINLGNQLLSIVVAGGLVAFGALVLRLMISGVKLISKKLRTSSKSVEIENKEK